MYAKKTIQCVSKRVPHVNLPIHPVHACQLSHCICWYLPCIHISIYISSITQSACQPASTNYFYQHSLCHLEASALYVYQHCHCFSTTINAGYLIAMPVHNITAFLPALYCTSTIIPTKWLPTLTLHVNRCLPASKLHLPA